LVYQYEITQGLIKSGYPSLSMCRIAAHAAYGGNKPMPQWAFFEVRYDGYESFNYRLAFPSFQPEPALYGFL